MILPPAGPTPTSIVMKDVISSIVVFAFSLTAFLMAANFGGGSELFPRGLAVIMMVAAALMFLRAVALPKLAPDPVANMERSDIGRTAVCVALTLGYVALIVPIGFAAASILFIATISYAMGMRRHLVIWLTAFGFVGVLYFLFVEVFYTPLPKGLIFSLFSGQ